jgi:protein SCO1/2
MRALTAIIVLAIACRSERPPSPAAPPAPPIVLPVATASIPLDAPPIYDLPIEMRDHDGRAIRLDVHRGNPVVIAMFYASCPAACPRLIDEVHDIVDAVPIERRNRLRVLLVSFDPRDTPERLRDLAVTRDIPLDHWTLATAAPDEARQLAAVLGIKYRVLDGGEYFHSSVITVLDGDGRPRARVEGFGVPPDALIAAIE